MLNGDKQETPLEIELRKAARENNTPGTLNRTDGFNCERCMNRGYFFGVEQRGDAVYQTVTECSCMPIRRSIMRLKASGLEDAIRRYSFKNFEVTEPWQQKMLDVAQQFLAEGSKNGAWLYIGGAVGSGKTHICAAVAGKLLYRGPLLYMSWPADATRLKAQAIDDPDAYDREMFRLQSVEYLLIDDFWKPAMGDNGPKPPTAADIRLTYELLNERYCDRKVTIISSERYLSELMDLDEAVGSRIAERSAGYCLTLGRDRAKNHRLKISQEVL